MNPEPATDEVRTRKAALREEMRARRRSVTVEEAARAGAHAAALLAAHLDAAGGCPSPALLYAPLAGELDTRPIDALLRGRGARIAYPRTIAADAAGAGRLSLHAATVAELAMGRFGIAEPRPTAAEIDAEALELVVVPGLAFDHSGRRLGFGGGYYDRLLERCREATRFGACLAAQLLDEVPAAPHDVPVDYILAGDPVGAASALIATRVRALPARRRAAAASNQEDR